MGFIFFYRHVIFHDFKQFLQEVNGVSWLPHDKVNLGIQHWGTEMGNQGPRVSEEEGQQCLSQAHLPTLCPAQLITSLQG